MESTPTTLLARFADAMTSGRSYSDIHFRKWVTSPLKLFTLCLLTTMFHLRYGTYVNFVSKGHRSRLSASIWKPFMNTILSCYLGDRIDTMFSVWLLYIKQKQKLFKMVGLFLDLPVSTGSLWITNITNIIWE